MMNEPERTTRVDVTPTSITRTQPAGIEITWSDGETSRWTTRQLRDACPCATCREKHGKQDAAPEKAKSLTLPVLSSAEARPLEITAMRPAGTYAYNIAFSDGHSSGLYTLDRLRKSESGVAGPN